MKKFFSLFASLPCFLVCFLTLSKADDIKPPVESVAPSKVTSQAVWGEASPTLDGYSLTLSSNKRTYEVGDLISLKAVLKNNSKENKKLFLSNNANLVSKYSLELFKVQKKPMIVTPAGAMKLLDARSAFGRGMVLVKPGDELIDDYNDLTKIYDLTEPGTYQVMATKSISVDEEKSKLSRLNSNIVEFEIQPKLESVKPLPKAAVQAKG